MTQPRSRLIAASLSSTLFLPGTAFADWSDDSAVNTLISGASGGAAVSHTQASPAGGFWVAWYDADAGYDVVAQYVDAAGAPQFDPPVVVADNAYSWVQDLDLATDDAGHAAIAWSDGTSTYAARVTLDGDIAFLRSFTGGYTANAQTCAGPSGSVMVAWGSDSVTKVQRLSSTGTDMWPTTTTIGASGTTTASDLRAMPDGRTLASFVAYASFNGAKRLQAAVIDATGSLSWGPTDVFSTGSLQFGAYPECMLDAAGGGIFTWYTSSPLMTRIQWMTPDGDRLLGINGMATTSETSMVHVSPAACYDPDSDTATVYWTRQNSVQSQAGVQVNRVQSDGTLYSANGTQVTALGSNGVHDLSAWQLGSMGCAAWLDAQTTGPSRVLASAFDASGDLPWNSIVGPKQLGTPFITRDGLGAAAVDGMGVAAWVDSRDGTDRVYAQNIQSDGSLGGVPCNGDITGDGEVSVDDLLALIESWGSANPAADVNGDGVVDTNDLLIVLGEWGPCAG